MYVLTDGVDVLTLVHLIAHFPVNVSEGEELGTFNYW